MVNEIDKPQPEEGQVLVKMNAAALNHRDVWIQKGQYAAIRFPVALGSDGAGVIEGLGVQTDPSWLGKEVVINPGFYWGNNELVQSKEFRILGMPDQGTLAEYICIPQEYIYIKPAHLTMEEASVLPLGGLTGYRAAFSRGGLKSGEHVLITGVGGGVALLAMQMAIAAGAVVWVTSGSDEKIQKASSLGARGGVNYHQENWHKPLQEAGGFDLIVDSACGDSFNKLIDLSKPGGRISFYGGTLGNINNVLPAKIFWKQLSILGSTMGSQSDFKRMMALVEEMKIKPIIDRVFNLSETEQAFRYLESGQQFGKIVVKIP
jgi:NADPH:quinone reductase-like Zn-dependent oxidoreductase